jgi:serine protease AprX
MNLRRYSGGSYTGLDGSGVGIAVLDSGLGWSHLNLLAADGKTSRVQKAVDFQKVGDATALGVKDWSVGIDASASLYPGSKTMADYESKIDATGANRSDLYGHGTHVASVAAGRGAYPGDRLTGVAPGANLYDVKVLDGNGYGQMSDVLAGHRLGDLPRQGIQHPRHEPEPGADSTESWQTDPLARAARSAVAAGITVVVAAGNFGQNADRRRALRHRRLAGARPVGDHRRLGQHQGHRTCAATTRVNFFSSRGPTRGAHRRQRRAPVDNLLKPDLVAPGNKIVGALASDKEGAAGQLELPGQDLPGAVGALRRRQQAQTSS